MKNGQQQKRTPDKTLTAVCGIFCPSCSVYIGTQEDPKRLKWMAQRFGRPVEELACHGCRAKTRAFHCQNCQFVACAAEKGVDFCGACSEYPCEALKTFQSEMPHRIELWESHKRLQDVGYETWYQEMVEHYSCPECHTINSAYDIACRKCGTTPSCEYVILHKEQIKEYLKKAL